MNGENVITSVVTSPECVYYNCIAWAAKEDIRWWEPDIMGYYYWPEEIPRRYTVDAYMMAYGTLGYVVCKNEILEEGFEKIALYADSNKRPKHAARQLPDGNWTSKLGKSFDVRHEFIDKWSEIICRPDNIRFNVSSYGTIEAILKRPV